MELQSEMAGFLIHSCIFAYALLMAGYILTVKIKG
jgi:hypothetical protein